MIGGLVVACSSFKAVKSFNYLCLFPGKSYPLISLSYFSFMVLFFFFFHYSYGVLPLVILEGFSYTSTELSSTLVTNLDTIFSLDMSSSTSYHLSRLAMRQIMLVWCLCQSLQALLRSVWTARKDGNLVYRPWVGVKQLLSSFSIWLKQDNMTCLKVIVNLLFLCELCLFAVYYQCFQNSYLFVVVVIFFFTFQI